MPDTLLGQRRHLTWFLPGQLEVGAPKVETYKLDRQYTPVTCSIHSQTEATSILPDAVEGEGASWTEIDIRANGVSILGGNAALILTAGVTQDYQTSFLQGLQLKEGDLITVHVTRLATGESGSYVTIELVLEVLQPEA